jgi:hypothetical protein
MEQLFTATLRTSPNKGGWTYVVWPASAEFFGTRGLVKGRGICPITSGPSRVRPRRRSALERPCPGLR